jgi:hypothetical protein
VTDWKDNGKTNVDLPDNQQMAATTAINYKYADNYTYTGKLYASGNEVVYVPLNATPDENMMHDLARFLGALHRGAGVSKITYDGKEYIWDPTRVKELGIANNTELKGSNWINADNKTLVSVITANAQNEMADGKLEFKADNDNMTIYFAANYKFKSFGKQESGDYVAWGSGTVFAFTDPVTINQNSYRKVLVWTNEADASFVGNFYYVEEAAATSTTDAKWELFDQLGNGLGIYVTFEKITQN